ncbi:MAG TPA: hypothetical protein VFZ73_00540 [Gemmatimonadaceae bacterium]
MGAWGYGIRQDDFVLDVIGDFEDLLRRGQSIRDTSAAIQAKFAGAMADADDGPLLWIALAEVQWTYGELDPEVRRRVQEDFDSGRSLAAWSDDPRRLSRRTSVLAKFISKIAHPNTRPRKVPRRVVRAPRFSAGDCLSIRLPNGLYSAALVLVADHVEVEYGRNLVGVMDYLSPEKPAIEVFRERNWLVLDLPGRSVNDIAWYEHIGYRSVKDRLEVVGKVEILSSDPNDSNFYRRWTGIGERGLDRRGKR